MFEQSTIETDRATVTMANAQEALRKTREICLALLTPARGVTSGTGQAR